MKHCLLVLLFSLASLSAFAQQYGHVNFGNLLSEMPQVASAEKELQTYEKEQLAIGEKMVTDFRAAVAAAEAAAPTTTPKDLVGIKKKLEQQQQAIQQFEQQMSVNIERKRQELLGPIIQQAKAAVEAVGQAGGYLMIFDSSIFGNILFAEEATDLTAAVKTKLGL